MTVIDFDDLNPGAKFDFETDSDGAIISWVKVRAYSVESLEEIRAKCVKQEIEYKKAAKHAPYQRLAYETTDDKTMKEMLWDFLIMDWGGFFDKEGRDIPCTKENKITFMGKWPRFYAFVDKCLEQLTPDVNEAVHKLEKN